MVSFTALPLHPRRNGHRYKLNRRLAMPHSRSGRYREKRNLLPLPGIETSFDNMQDWKEIREKSGEVNRMKAETLILPLEFSMAVTLIRLNVCTVTRRPKAGILKPE
jgi:hypothetical protein